MTAAAMPATTPEPLTAQPPITQCSAIFEAVFGPWRSIFEGVFFVHVVAGRGTAATHASLPAHRHWDPLPPAVAKEFAYRTVDDLRLVLSTTNQAGDQVLGMSAAWIELALPPVFEKWKGKSEDWRVPSGVLDAATARLAAGLVPRGRGVGAVCGLATVRARVARQGAGEAGPYRRFAARPR